jgi:hypothetical protein
VSETETLEKEGGKNNFTVLTDSLRRWNSCLVVVCFMSKQDRDAQRWNAHFRVMETDYHKMAESLIPVSSANRVFTVFTHRQ